MAGVDIPDGILEWAEAHGLDHRNPDIYMLVTTEEHPGWLGGAIASTEGVVTARNGARIDEARTENEATARL